MREQLSDFLAQHPDSYRIAVLVGDDAVPVGLNVGQLTVMLARSEALYASNTLIEEQSARIAELEAALDSDPDGSGYWRFWSDKAAEQAKRASASQARLSEAVKVLEEANSWHEEQDKALSKQPRTHGPSGNQWTRLQHREQIERLSGAIASLGGNKNEA